MTVRRGAKDDLDAITAIEAASFDDPWSREDFAAAFESPVCEYCVAEDEDGVIGYALFSIVYEDAEIMSIAVDMKKRRGGAGRAMLERIVERAKNAEAETIFLEVRESNGAAISLYESVGFEVVRRIRRYYRRPTEDAIVMRLTLTSNE